MDQRDGAGACGKGEIPTAFGETLSWDYLCYVRAHPVSWQVPTHILYGEHDNLTSIETISAFAERNGAALTVMPGGEHWFHTEEQMRFWMIGSYTRGQYRSTCAAI